MLEFIGHLHPVLVHLPIGILLVAVLFYLLSLQEKYSSLRPGAGLALFIGMICAIASCISGYILSTIDDYDNDLVSSHKWMGIAVAAISMISWLLHYKKLAVVKWMVATLAVLIFITGHSGGSLTHGSDYLTKMFSTSSLTVEDERKPIPDVQEAAVYEDVVQPLLSSKCYSCHNANKQKGKLRLDDPEWILLGGKDRAALIPGKADQSEMIKRLLLPRHHEDHMPPKEKSQLTEEEIALLHWWVSSGASFEKKVKEIEQTEKIKPVLLALQTAVVEDEKEMPDLPEKPVEKAADSSIKKLIDRGAVVLPVASNTNYLMVNFVSVPDLKDDDLKLLLPLEKQLSWLKLGGHPITDSALKYISRCTSLTRLHLDHTDISDTGLSSLQTLKELHYLNLVATKISAKGLSSLKNLQQLQSVYIYQTVIDKKDHLLLAKNFPNTKFETGGYALPVLVSDTTKYTKEEK